MLRSALILVISGLPVIQELGIWGLAAAQSSFLTASKT